MKSFLLVTFVFLVGCDGSAMSPDVSDGAVTDSNEDLGDTRAAQDSKMESDAKTDSKTESDVKVDSKIDSVGDGDGKDGGMVAGSKLLGDECSEDSECSVGKCVFGQPDASSRNVTVKVCCDKDCSDNPCTVCQVAKNRSSSWCGLVTCLPIGTYRCNATKCPHACCKA